MGIFSFIRLMKLYRFNITETKFDAYPKTSTTDLVWLWYIKHDQYWNCIIDSDVCYVSFSLLDSTNYTNLWYYELGDNESDCGAY